MCDLGVDAISEGVDYCDNRGPMMGLPRFRRFILPFLERIVKAVHAKGKYFVKHSDGNNWVILDDMVEIGVDGWQGIQPHIGMDMKALKQRYGSKLCLFGGVDNRSLIAGSADDVVGEVEYAIRHAGRGGGLVLTCSNTLQPGVKYENYMAMLRATRELGAYPLSL
jgi:uroporphyrinogen decarboxylase